MTVLPEIGVRLTVDVDGTWTGRRAAIGQGIRARAEFYNRRGGAPAEVTDPVITVQPPVGSNGALPAPLAFGVAQLFADGVGAWYLDFPGERAGAWRVRAACSAPLPAAAEGSVTIQASNVVPPSAAAPMMVTDDLSPMVTRPGGVLTAVRITDLPAATDLDGLVLPAAKAGQSLSVPWETLRDAAAEAGGAVGAEAGAAAGAEAAGAAGATAGATAGAEAGAEAGGSAGAEAGATAALSAIADLAPAQPAQVTPDASVVGLGPDGTPVKLSPQQLAGIPTSVWGQIVRVALTGTGSAGPYTLPAAPSSDSNLLLFVNGTLRTDWTRSGSAVTFASAVASGATIAGIVVQPITDQSANLILTMDGSGEGGAHYWTDPHGFIRAILSASGRFSAVGGVAVADPTLDSDAVPRGYADLRYIREAATTAALGGLRVVERTDGAYGWSWVLTDQDGFILGGWRGGAFRPAATDLSGGLISRFDLFGDAQSDLQPTTLRQVQAMVSALDPQERAATGFVQSIHPVTSYNQPGAEAYTYHTTWEAEAPFDFVRAVFANTQTTPYPIDKCILASSASLADMVSPVDETGAAAPWVTETFDAAGSPDAQPPLTAGSVTSLAAMPTSLDNVKEVLAFGDWVRLSSYERTDVPGARPVIMMRAYNASAPMHAMSTVPDWDQGSGGLYPAPPVFKGWRKAGDFCATPSGMTQANSAVQRTLYGVQYLSRARGATVVSIGDSIEQGVGIYTPVAFSAVTCSGTTATAVLVTSTDTSKFAVGDRVISRGVTPAGYNLWGTVTAIGTGTVSWTVSTVHSGMASGGAGELCYEIRTHDGPVRRACARISTQSMPVQFYARAVRGTNSDIFGTNGVRAIEALKPHVLVLPAFTPNNGLTVANAGKAFQDTMLMRQRARALGIASIILTPVPTNYALRVNPTADSYKAAVEWALARTREAAAAGAVVVDDWDDIAVDGETWQPGMSDDGVHPTDAAFEIRAAALEATLRNVLALPV